MGLERFKDKPVNRLSGGQKQRVAIARALLLDSKYIFADEPTGNLDSSTSENIMELFKEISKDKLVVMVSHNKELLEKYASRIITIKDGKIISDEIKEDIVDNKKNENTLNDSRKISLKSIFKLRKAANLKNNTSKIFNIFFTFLLLLTFFLGVNIITNTKADIITYASKNTNFKNVDFRFDSSKINKTDKKYIDDDIVSLLQKKNNNAMLVYNVPAYLEPINEKNQPFMVDKIYVTDKVEGRQLNDGEIIFSYKKKYELKKCFDPYYKINEFKDNSYLFDGEKIKIKGKEYTVKGMDKEIHCQFDEEKNEHYEEFLSYASYFYCNENTFNSLMLDDTAVFEIALDEEKVNSLIMKPYDYKELILGNIPKNSNEIVINEQLAKGLFNDVPLEDVIGKTIKVTSTWMGNKKYLCDFIISGIGEVNGTTSEIFKEIYKYSSEYMNAFYNRGVSFNTHNLNKDIASFLFDNNIIDSFIISGDIEKATSLSLIVGSILFVVSLPLGVLLFVFQGVNSKQVILSNRRIIGIMRSMSYSRENMNKIFIADSISQNIISLIISLGLSPIVVMMFNNFFIGKKIISFPFLRLKVYIIILMFIALLIVSVLCVVIGVKKLDKKSDVDLVYER